MDALLMTQGPVGVKVWLLEVQLLIRALRKRSFVRMPLYVLFTLTPRLFFGKPVVNGVQVHQLSDKLCSIFAVTGEE